MIKIRELESGYDKKQVLYGLSFNVHRNEIVALIGPNGAGKSTVLKTIFGLIPAWNGEIKYNDTLINNSKPSQNVARGITLAPQGNRVFRDLTVEENIKIGGCQLAPKVLKERITKVLDFFPLLRERIRQDAGRLSGGEQQMLSLARALISEPSFLMLDEPSLGLSPKLVKMIFNKVHEICHTNNVGILIVEQKVLEILEICNRVYSMKLGKVVFEGVPDDLKCNNAMLKRLFL